MNKSNIHKKYTSDCIDYYARKFYPQRSRLNQIRSDKRRARKKYRKTLT